MVALSLVSSRGKTMVKKQKYDWKKTASKMLWVLAEIIVAGALVYVTENPMYIGLVPVLEGARNYIKHK